MFSAVGPAGPKGNVRQVGNSTEAPWMKLRERSKGARRRKRLRVRTMALLWRFHTAGFCIQDRGSDFCMHVRVCVHGCAHVCTSACVCTCLCECVCTFVHCECMCECACECMSVHACKCALCVCACVCAYACVIILSFRTVWVTESAERTEFPSSPHPVPPMLISYTVRVPLSQPRSQPGTFL